jgi:hypothetical protein
MGLGIDLGAGRKNEGGGRQAQGGEQVEAEAFHDRWPVSWSGLFVGLDAV